MHTTDILCSLFSMYENKRKNYPRELKKAKQNLLNGKNQLKRERNFPKFIRKLCPQIYV